MEEILASIRRIISEDEPPAAPEALTAPEEPTPPPPPAAAEVEDVLELTDRVPEPAPQAVETLGDLDVLPASFAEPAPREPEPVAEPMDHDDFLVSPPAADAASTAFGQLSQSILMPRDGRTLEDVVRELLRPLLKAWLDEHLPGIVQAAVNEEVERLARRRV